MDKTNKQLLDEVIKNNLEKVNDAEASDEAKQNAIEIAMKAVDRDLEIDKSKKERLIKIAEVTAGVVITPVIYFICNKAYAKMLCNFEKDYTFTTSAGRGLKDLFKLKKC